MKRALALLLCLGVLPAHAETLTLNGLGPVRIGMRFTEVEKAMGAKITYDERVSGGPAGCVETNWPGREEGSLMFQNYRLTRLGIWGKNHGVTTAKGAGIGTGEAELRRLYGRRAVFSPHPYLDEDGHYITVRYPGQNRKLIFETEHGKVTSFRVGLPKPVEYIEGCL